MKGCASAARGLITYWRLLEKATMKKVVVLSKKEEEKRKPRAA